MPNTYPPGWAKNATTPAPPTETIFSQEYTPDWPSIPGGFDWVAVDSDGIVYRYKVEKPFSTSSDWTNGYVAIRVGIIDAPSGDHWETMLYQRPNNTAA